MGTSRTAAALVLVGLAVAGCSGDGDTAGTGRTITPDVAPQGPGPAPAVATPVPPDEVWGLAQLVPPEDVTVTSSVRRPDTADMASYLLVATTTAAGAASLCDQLGGLVPAADGLASADLPGWGLDQVPPGELGTCRAADPVVPSVQREVLVATTEGDGGTQGSTVWVSTYETP